MNLSIPWSDREFHIFRQLLVCGGIGGQNEGGLVVHPVEGEGFAVIHVDTQFERHIPQKLVGSERHQLILDIDDTSGRGSQPEGFHQAGGLAQSETTAAQILVFLDLYACHDLVCAGIQYQIQDGRQEGEQEHPREQLPVY